MRWPVRSLLGAVTVMAVVMCTVQAAQAVVGNWREYVTLMVSERARGEFVDWFRPPSGAAPSGAHRYDFFGNQFRVGLRINLPHVGFTVQMQDTRLVNLPDDATPPASSVGALGPGALYFLNTHDRDQGEPFLKLGYLTITDIPGASGLSVTLGRFEYSSGLETVPAEPALAWVKRWRISQRLVGPFGYTHVTRSFDGFRFAYDQAAFNLTAWGSRPTQGGFEVSANPELDVWLAGAALTLKQIENFPPLDASLFYLYYLDERDNTTKADNRPAAERSADTDNVVVHTAGAHLLTVADAGPGKVDGLIWAVVQGGEWGTLDHAAWAYALEGGYQVPHWFAAPWVRVGYNRSSGDDNPDDDTHETFFQVMPTARVYAQFPFFNLMNNEDLFAQLILKPHARVIVRTDYHWLRLTERRDLWYAGGGATNGRVFGFAGSPSGGRRELAHLVDVAILVTLHTHLKAYAYYGRAFGQGVVKQTFAGASANYGFVELRLRY